MELGTDDEHGAEIHGGSRAFMRARHELKKALAAKWRGPADEQRRILDILKRATEEILNGPQS